MYHPWLHVYLLIHEAYGPGDDAQLTHSIGHSTAAEAGETARVAGVRHLILTHLRARHFVDPGKLRVEASSAFGGTVEVARDLSVFDF